MTTSITAAELLRLRSSGEDLDLIDVRTPAEFGECHVDRARNVPLAQLDPATLTRDRPAGRALYVICQSGTRSRMACDQLIAAGLTGVFSVEGGTKACEAAGVPVVRGRRTVISLERQVRIAAGSLVLTGVILGTWVHPGWIGLAGFVGAGLVFAGVTDTCGMGLVLARMPWNQGAACEK